MRFEFFYGEDNWTSLPSDWAKKQAPVSPGRSSNPWEIGKITPMDTDGLRFVGGTATAGQVDIYCNYD